MPENGGTVAFSLPHESSLTFDINPEVLLANAETAAFPEPGATTSATFEKGPVNLEIQVTMSPRGFHSASVNLRLSRF